MLPPIDRPGDVQSLKETELAAISFGIKPHYLDVRDQKALEPAFRNAGKDGGGAVLVLTSPIFNSQRTQVISLASKARVPTMYPQKGYVEEGGLITYGTSVVDSYRRAATYVDKILKGAKPADLPIQQATKFEFIVNLKAAKQIGLTIPVRVLERANQVIK
jgi:putative ABC transport system substrate-binding protein